jgi:hypothetical protein
MERQDCGKRSRTTLDLALFSRTRERPSEAVFGIRHTTTHDLADTRDRRL